MVRPYFQQGDASSRAGAGRPWIVRGRGETVGFGLVLAACLAGFFHKTLLGDRVLSPADVLLVEASFREEAAGDYEPFNRLLMDPVLQFQPWLEFNRSMIRQGRLPLWNPHAGCGAPHLANGQSSVFDPFCLLAYFGRPPWAWAQMAASRLWVAGLGMFLLARAWGLGAWGRWFAGLAYPFCGFLIIWLLYPVTPVAVWLPWIVLATDRVLREPRARPVGLLAVVTALVIVGGHIQTSAHVLLAAGFFAFWKTFSVQALASQRRGGLLAWTAGIGLGLLLASVQILPLGCYLARSPVWGDRQREGKPWWTLSRPRLLDAACTALPYAYGSQRRGHPNLARGLAVHNLNESAGGYAGLVTLVWLAPLGLRNERRAAEISFLAGLTLIGAMGAFQLPPVRQPAARAACHRGDRQPSAGPLGGLWIDPAGGVWAGRPGAGRTAGAGHDHRLPAGRGCVWLDRGLRAGFQSRSPRAGSAAL